MITLAHTFHIPVMGLGFTIDTPVKVARFGITSVVSIIEDSLVEQMRKYYCEQEHELYVPINKNDPDYRARRITEYLNLLNRIVNRQIEELKKEPFHPGSEIAKYFEMLPDDSILRKVYLGMLEERDELTKLKIQDDLRRSIVAGSIDVNIMTKCDRINYDENDEPLAVEYADAMSALRGFAMSDLNSSVVFSAGMNPRLYSYCETFNDFLPDENGQFRKRIILKVSDYRSALVQGKFLAKKGLWISEFRVESGLNCGGHAFPTDGFLLGPIMEEFKSRRAELRETLFEVYNSTFIAKNGSGFNRIPETKISVQGGIGSHNENQFLLEHYNLDATGWGSPFLLVPEATNVDAVTLRDLSEASPSDYFLSHASPLGLPFNNFRKSSAEAQRKERISKGRPGSPCYKKFLAFNTEFTKKPICTSSREYQKLKLEQIANEDKPEVQKQFEIGQLMEKDCLCEGLSSSVLLKNNIRIPHNLPAVSICPGPNLAYFTGIFSLKEMIDHIYGRANILNNEKRPQMFLKELRLYVDYYKKEMEQTLLETGNRKQKQLEDFKRNLLNGIEYYFNLIPVMRGDAESYLQQMYADLCSIRNEISNPPVLVVNPL